MFYTSYILFFSLCLCSTMQICKIFFAFSNMIQDVFVPLYFNSWYPCFFSSNHIYILVSLHTFWTYCTAIYGLMLFLNATIFLYIDVFAYILGLVAKHGWDGIRINCPSGVTCLLTDCCFSELAL